MSGPGNFLSFFNTKFLEFFIKPSVSPPLYNRRDLQILLIAWKTIFPYQRKPSP